MRAILQLKTIAQLKKMIRETNITGYSKLNKKQIIDKMMKEDKRFMDYVLKSHKQQQKENAKKDVKKTPMKKLKPKQEPKEKKPSAKELTDKAIEKAKAGGAKVVRAKKEEPKEKLTDKERKDREEQLNYLRKIENSIKENNFDSYNRRTLSRLIMFLKKKSKYITDKYTDKQIKKFLDVAEKIKEDREKPTAKELTDKAIEKAKAGGAKVVKAKPKKEKTVDFSKNNLKFKKEILAEIPKLRQDGKKVDIFYKWKDDFNKLMNNKKIEITDYKIDYKSFTQSNAENIRIFFRYHTVTDIFIPLQKIEDNSPKKEKKKAIKKAKPLKPTPTFEEIKKQKPIQNTYTSSKQDEDDFARLFASLK